VRFYKIERYGERVHVSAPRGAVEPRAGSLAEDGPSCGHAGCYCRGARSVGRCRLAVGAVMAVMSKAAPCNHNSTRRRARMAAQICRRASLSIQFIAARAPASSRCQGELVSRIAWTWSEALCALWLGCTLSQPLICGDNLHHTAFLQVASETVPPDAWSLLRAVASEPAQLPSSLEQSNGTAVEELL
jgi:hypothetical protein